MITAADLVRRKSQTTTDTTQNGGVPGRALLRHGVRNDLLPRPSSQDYAAGRTVYRKFFLTNESTIDAEASAALACLLAPSPAGDRLAIAPGTLTDRQSAVTPDAGRCWMGVGALGVALSGGESSITMQMDATGYGFLPGGYINISSQFLASQTIASNVSPGDSVLLSAGTWQRATTSTDAIHPRGIYCGDELVYTLHGTANAELVQVADLLRTAEVVGTGNGSTTPTLATLADAGNGVVPWTGYRPVLNATCGGVARTVYVAADGTCSGYCAAGKLNMATGAWTTPVAWTTAPDNGTDVTITYRERSDAWTGNQVVVELAAQVLHAYPTATTYAAGCVFQESLTPSVDGYLVSSVAGTFSNSTNPVVAHCLGGVEETWTLTFTGATAFTCTGLTRGSVGTGSIAANFAPINPDTGSAYFTLHAAAWGGTWAAGGTLTFTTHPAALPVWARQVLPAGTPAAETLALLWAQAE